MAKLVKKGEPPKEFIDKEGKMLFDDIDGPVDDAWRAAMKNRRKKKLKKGGGKPK